MLFLMTLALPQSMAQDKQDKAPASAEEIRQRLEEVKTRLKLTDDQVTQLKPLVQEELQKLRALHDKYTGDTSSRARRAKLREAKSIQSHFDENLEKILTKDQMKEWKRLRSERRKKLKEEMERRGSQA
jgi:hypothetical protein